MSDHLDNPVDIESKEDVEKELIRIKERIIAECSSRRTREDQIFSRIDKLKSEYEKIEQGLEEEDDRLNQEIRLLERKIEEHSGRLKGKVQLIHWVFPVFVFIVGLLLSGAWYVFNLKMNELESKIETTQSRLHQIEERQRPRDGTDNSDTPEKKESHE